MFAFNVNAEMNSNDVTAVDEAIESPTLNIEGQYKVEEPALIPAPVKVEAPKPRKLTQSEKLKFYREKLEERNRIMVEKKMEQIRYRQELALARQLEQSMNTTLKAIDTVKN